jgi:hypothetical protein
LSIVNAALDGFPYCAQDILEGAIATRVIQEDSSLEALALIVPEQEHKLPLLQLLSGSQGPQAA